MLHFTKKQIRMTCQTYNLSLCPINYVFEFTIKISHPAVYPVVNNFINYIKYYEII